MIWLIDGKNQASHVNTVLTHKMTSCGYHHGKSLSNQNSNFFFGVYFIGFYQLWNVWHLEVWS
ncbi:hypothetical protein LINPERPRIM_LOCUS287 [Linum perenne]